LGAGAAACGKGEQDQHVVQCMSDYSTMLGNLGAGNGHRRRLQRVGDAQSAQAQTLMVAGLATASSGPLVRRQTRAALLNCTQLYTSVHNSGRFFHLSFSLQVLQIAEVQVRGQNPERQATAIARTRFNLNPGAAAPSRTLDSRRPCRPWAQRHTTQRDDGA
jgi:hypothetical protein